jgi:large subunit ribosomal protein L15
LIKLHDLHPAPGAHKSRKRVGRGIAGKGGKTAGRGTKGQGARDTIPVGFEGGQLPITQRLPKLKGFKNPFRIAYQAVNLDQINRLAASGITEINPQILVERGLASKGAVIKVLGRGALNTKVDVSAHAFSQSAREKIVSMGGTVVEVPLPYKSGRRPASGNALMNR